jgi:excisionase family DNA binding protein
VANPPAARDRALIKPVERLAYSVDELIAATGISRPSIYRRIADGTLKTVKFGKRRLISAEAFRALFKSEEAAEEEPNAPKA